MVDAPLPHPELLAAIPRLRRYARVLAGDAARADDLVQETLARAWEKRRLWQAGTDLRAWLFTIMHNVFVNQRASAAARRAQVSLDADTESGRSGVAGAGAAAAVRARRARRAACSTSAGCRSSSARR